MQQANAAVTTIAIFAGIYSGASLPLKVRGPMMLPRPGHDSVSFSCPSKLRPARGLDHHLQKDISRTAFMVTFLV